ncbi:MAG TPA: apolipoprotein N-acyltransferase [Verrucomicrobiae bacterium]
MPRFCIAPELRLRYALAAIAGVFLALAFPRVSVAGLAWVAPGLLLFAAVGLRPGSAFRVGYVGGFAYYLCTLNWLLYIPVKFFPILGWIALSAYLSLYPALWVWICWKFFPKHDLQPGAGNRPELRFLATTLLAGARWKRTLWAIQCGAVWVALEMTLGRFLSGFPWDFLGVSQYKMLPIIQVSAFTGVYGVSFLIIWFSAALMLAGAALVRTPNARGVWIKELALPMLTLAILTSWGISQLRSYTPSAERTKVALIQPSIPQTLIWDQNGDSNRFIQLVALSEKALAEKPDIMIWPEASVPNMLRHHEETGAAIVRLAKEHNVWAIVGSDDAELRPGGSTMRDVDYFNSAFAISPEGRLTHIYKKRQLVIFGEYIPFVKTLPFMKYLSPAGETGFTPGSAPVPFNLESLDVIASVLICFEDTFPHLVREYVEANTDILVNLTNNGWFGESAAQWQHAATAVFRAVENRIPLVRCANNGLTCWVDPVGGIHELYFPDSKDIYKVGYKIAEVPVLGRGESRELTFYTRRGDVFGWTCFFLVVLNLAAHYIRRGLKRKVPDSPAA